jgi:hypothetical protein
LAARTVAQRIAPAAWHARPVSEQRIYRAIDAVRERS